MKTKIILCEAFEWSCRRKGLKAFNYGSNTMTHCKNIG